MKRLLPMGAAKRFALLIAPAALIISAGTTISTEPRGAASPSGSSQAQSELCKKGYLWRRAVPTAVSRDLCGA